MSQEEIKAIGSFEENPDNTIFETQAKNEKVVLLLRRHWYTNLKWLFFAFIILFIPPLVLNILLWSGSGLVTLVGINYQIILTALWYLGCFGFIFQNFLIWYFNVYIVTNKRIIDVDFVGLFYKQISEAELEKVQDMTYRMVGFWHTFFNAGDIVIQTAGEVENLEFCDVPYPTSVQSTISQLMAERKK